MARRTGWMAGAMALLVACVAAPPAPLGPADGPRAAAAADPTAYSFVVLGCNRVETEDLSTDNPSTANQAQLNRSFAEIARLQPTPAFVFFAGDLVHGKHTDLSLLERELRAWRQLYEQSPLAGSGSRLVALPGNHELLKNRTFPPDQVTNPGADQVWLKVMQPYIAGDNGPRAGGADHLQADESRLTYSLDYRDTHFLVLNTDTVGAPSTVPVHWIADDLQAAKARPDVRHVFAIGHKPAFTPPRTDAEDVGLDAEPTRRNAFWETLDRFGAEAMVAAHAHRYYRSRPAGFSPWQIVAGNGGSKLEPQLQPAERFFGFTVVRITQGGKVLVDSYGRDEPAAGYLAPADGYPTTVRETVDITRP